MVDIDCKDDATVGGVKCWLDSAGREADATSGGIKRRPDGVGCGSRAVFDGEGFFLAGIDRLDEANSGGLKCCPDSVVRTDEVTSGGVRCCTDRIDCGRDALFDGGLLSSGGRACDEDPAFSDDMRSLDGFDDADKALPGGAFGCPPTPASDVRWPFCLPATPLCSLSLLRAGCPGRCSSPGCVVFRFGCVGSTGFDSDGVFSAIAEDVGAGPGTALLKLIQAAARIANQTIRLPIGTKWTKLDLTRLKRGMGTPAVYRERYTGLTSLSMEIAIRECRQLMHDRVAPGKWHTARVRATRACHGQNKFWGRWFPGSTRRQPGT